MNVAPARTVGVISLLLLMTALSPLSSSGRRESGEAGSAPEGIDLKAVSARPPNAETGSQFAARTVGMSPAACQREAMTELCGGNVPNFLRHLKPIRLSYQPVSEKPFNAVLWVTPDYLAIGSDDDFLRMPLNYFTAVAVARNFGCVLPTTKIVDAIYEQADIRLEPQPLPPGRLMRSMWYFLRHQRRIEARQGDSFSGKLVSGLKKDLVLTNRLHRRSNRVPIYGWHRKEGDPIQPLSTLHVAGYADYSHGIRLVSQTVWINGRPRSIFDVLKDPILAPLLSDEGVISDPEGLMGFRR